MKNYNFIKFIPRKPRAGGNWLTLSQQHLQIGKIAYEVMGYPENISIYIDVDKKAIKLIANPRGLKVHKLNHTISAVTLARTMPLGHYLPVGDGIFILDNLKKVSGN